MRRLHLGLTLLAAGCGVSLFATSCGGSLMDEPLVMPAEPVADAPPAVDGRPSPPPGSLWRKDVNATVEEGLGYFLQRVAVEPELAAGKFQGFRITNLRPPEFWTGVDLKPGDVVQQVNGKSIERDIDAYHAFEGLKAARELRVGFLRGGAKRELVFAIVDDGRAAPKTGPAAPAAAPPATPAAPPAAPPAPATGKKNRV